MFGEPSFTLVSSHKAEMDPHRLLNSSFAYLHGKRIRQIERPILPCRERGSTNPDSHRAGTCHVQTLMSLRSLLWNIELSARIRDYAVTTTSVTHVSLSGRILT